MLSTIVTENTWVTAKEATLLLIKFGRLGSLPITVNHKLYPMISFKSPLATSTTTTTTVVSTSDDSEQLVQFYDSGNDGNVPEGKDETNNAKENTNASRSKRFGCCLTTFS